MRPSVDLPAPFSPTMRVNGAMPDCKRDVGERLDASEVLRDTLELELRHVACAGVTSGT